MALDVSPWIADKTLDFDIETAPAPIHTHARMLHNAIRYRRKPGRLKVRLLCNACHWPLLQQTFEQIDKLSRPKHHASVHNMNYSNFLRFGTALTTALLASTLAYAAPAAPAPSAATAAPVSAACPAILKHNFNRLQDEAPQNLCQYAGKVVLVVNTASFCGFTDQYEGLEALYAKYKGKGLVVMGFPSNDFGQQEPGTNKEIADFCYNTYAVKFPMFSKTVVSGPERNALFAQLVNATGTAPKWNFYKYLIDRNGKVVNSYNSMTKPLSKSLTGDIEKLL